MMENWAGFDPAVIFVTVMLGFTMLGDVEYAVTQDVPEDCSLVTAEVVGKGRVDDGFDLDCKAPLGLDCSEPCGSPPARVFCRVR